MRTEETMPPVPFLLLFGRPLRKGGGEQFNSATNQGCKQPQSSSVRTRLTEIERETTDDD